MNAGGSPHPVISNLYRKEGPRAVGGRHPGGAGPTPIDASDLQGVTTAAERAETRRSGGRMEQVRPWRRGSAAPRGWYDRLEARPPRPVAAAPPRR